MRLLGYTRVSTDEQAESGLGLDAQEHAIRAEADRRGWELLEVIRDAGKSGKDIDHRPGLRRALREIAAGHADGLVVAKLDRLSRSTIDFGVLLDWFENDAAATFIALDLNVDTSTAGGRLVANVFASVAEWERSVIAERTKAGLAALRARGLPAGRPAVADDADLATRIRAMRDRGMSMQAIADQLNTDRIPTPRGGKLWRKSTIQSALGYRRPKPGRRHTSLPPVRRRRRAR